MKQKMIFSPECESDSDSERDRERNKGDRKREVDNVEDRHIQGVPVPIVQRDGKREDNSCVDREIINNDLAYID